VAKDPSENCPIAPRPQRITVTRRSLVLFTAAALVAAPTAAFAGSHTSASTATPGSKQVPSVLAGLSRATRVAAAPAGQRLSIGVGLSRPDPAGENALLAAEYDPHSASYHHFLTPQQFNARFGIPSSTVAATRSWLTHGGLQVTSVSPDGNYVMASGTVRQVDALTHVSINRYRDAKDGSFIANNVAPSVPASLPISAVIGLDTVQTVQPSLAAPRTLSHKSAASAATFSGVLSPRNLWHIYHQPTSNEGQGQKIGIFGEGETDSVVTQLRLFEHHEHFPKVPVRVVHTEGGSSSAYGDNTGSIEWYLDAQASTGMAPKVSQLDLYFAKSLFDKDIAKDFSSWVNDPKGPRQMNASFGECETNPTNPVTGGLAQIPYGTELGDELEPVAEPMLKQAVAEGRTLFASAGDTGSGCPEVVVPVAGAGNGLGDQPVPIVNYPAASAYAVGVGGTVIRTPAKDHNKRVTEQAWLTTGGGPSKFIKQPKFQAKTTAINSSNAPCLTNYSGTTPYPAGTVCRGTPDIAALSGNTLGNGYFIYIDGEPSSEGGTSLSSPLSMGMWARLQAGAKSSHGLGFADNTFYRQADKSAASYKRDFHDIVANETKGEAGASTTNGFYTTRKGYDFTTGLGALNVAHLLTDVDHTTKARHHTPKPEKAGIVRSIVRMTSPKGNAVNPVDVQAGNLAAADLTKGKVYTHKHKKRVYATMYGPKLSSTPDSAATGGENYYAYWRQGSHVYFLLAQTQQGGAPVFSGGVIKKSGYIVKSSVKATGSFKGHVLRMSAPYAHLGHPKRGTQLVDPALISQLVASGTAGTVQFLALTVDSASASSYKAASRGDAVCVGRCSTHSG
jgi:hypothetical protein